VIRHEGRRPASAGLLPFKSMDAFQLIVRDIPESWRQLQKRDYTGVSRASRSLTWAGVPSPQLGSGLSDAAPRPTVGFSPRQTAYRARHMRILVTGASGVLGRVTVPLLRDRGHQLRCRRRPNSTCSTRSRYGRHSATSTRCCIWPATFRPPIAGAFPVPGTRTTDYETRRPDCSLTAPYLPIRRSSWCPRSRSSIRQAQPMSPRRWQTCLSLRSALEAENHLRRFNDAGRRGVRVAPWFALWTGSRVAHAQRPLRRSPHTEDAGSALVAALSCPGGVYDVCDDTDPASHDRFTEATAGAHDRGDRQPSP
jgi:hypothetical protein